MAGKIIGIDLGTTYSCVAIKENGSDTSVTIIPNKEGNRTTPSFVAMLEDSTLVGDPAKRQSIMKPKETIFSVKRLIGKQFNNKDVQEKIKSMVPYEIVASNNGDAWVQVRNNKYSPSEISAKILAELKKAAEDYLGETVSEAVITVPAYFNDSQRQATKDAGTIAGLDVKRIINEPTAAALAYGIDKANKDMTVAVYDLGGGTFDISILEISGGVFEVKSTNGDTVLGGEDFDNALIKKFIEEFKKSNPGFTGDLSKDPLVMQRLKEVAEKTKIELSSAMQSEVNLPYLTADATGPKHLNCTITRASFEAMTADLVERTIKPCEQALKDSGLTKDQIDVVLLVGGMTRMPKIQEQVKEFFGKEPSKGVNPDEAVAVGAAIQGAILRGDVKDILLLDVTPLDLGIETMGGVMTKLIEANTTIPTRKSQVFSTADDNQNAVSIRVCQGNRPMARDNKSLGEFTLSDIPPAPRGVPQIEVTFEIDANGILHVSAMDKTTGKQSNITIKSSGGLSDAEIERMKKEAEENAESDKRKQELIVAKNEAESLVHSAEKSLSEYKDKISSEVQSEIQASIAALKEISAQENATAEDIKAKTEECRNAMMKIGSAMYENQGQQTSSTEGTEQPEDIKDV